MNTEQLHDALNLLDDDMIEDVAALRQHRQRKNWVRWLSAAACFGLVCAVVFTAGRSGLLPSQEGSPLNTVITENPLLDDEKASMDNGKTPMEDEVYENLPNLAPPMENVPEMEAPTDAVVPDFEDPECAPNDAPVASEPAEMPYVLITVTEQTDNGFRGTIHTVNHCVNLSVGSHVTVVVTQDTAVIDRGDEDYTDSTQQELVIKVQYSRVEIKEESIILYASVIYR